MDIYQEYKERQTTLVKAISALQAEYDKNKKELLAKAPYKTGNVVKLKDGTHAWIVEIDLHQNVRQGEVVNFDNCFIYRGWEINPEDFDVQGNLGTINKDDIVEVVANYLHQYQRDNTINR